MMNHSVAKVLQCRQQMTLKARHVPSSLLDSLFVFVEVVLLLEFVVCCVGEVFVCCCCCCVCLLCCWVFRSSLLKTIHTSILFMYFTAPVSIGATTSSAKKLPHRVVTLKSTDKGEEEMAF